MTDNLDAHERQREAFDRYREEHEGNRTPDAVIELQRLRAEVIRAEKETWSTRERIARIEEIKALAPEQLADYVTELLLDDPGLTLDAARLLLLTEHRRRQAGLQ